MAVIEELEADGCGLVEEARLSGGAGEVGSKDCAGVGDVKEEKMPILGGAVALLCVDGW